MWCTTTYSSSTSFRVPLSYVETIPPLAVLTKVTERIVSTATARHYREQRRLNSCFVEFPNDAVEASLSPLWKTLDGDDIGNKGAPAMDNASHSSALSPAVPGLFGNLITNFHPTQPVGAQPVELKNRILAPSFIAATQPGGTIDGNSKATVDGTGTNAVSTSTHATPFSNSALKKHD